MKGPEMPTSFDSAGAPAAATSTRAAAEAGYFDSARLALASTAALDMTSLAEEAHEFAVRSYHQRGDSASCAAVTIMERVLVLADGLLALLDDAGVDPRELSARLYPAARVGRPA